jgi:hypothetical protein
MKNDDDLPEISLHNGTSSNDGEVSDRMVVNATQINGTHRGLDDFHIASSNTAIGTAIDQGGPIVVWSLELSGIDIEKPGA